MRSAIISGRLVQVRGLGSYLQYLEGCMINHANFILHTRPSDPPTGIPAVYSPYTLGAVSVSVVTGSTSFDTKLRYRIEISTSIPCKVMALTDANVEMFKDKVEDGGSGFGIRNGGGGGGYLSPTAGRSRSNSRSNLKGTRSRSNSRTSLYEDSWIDTLDQEENAAGGLGMGIHGLFERNRICTSSSRFKSLNVGEHVLELDTLNLNLDRFVAPHMPQPPFEATLPTSSIGSVGDVEMGTTLPQAVAAGAGADAGAGARQPDKVSSTPVPPSEVTFALLIVPEGHCMVDLDVGSPEVAYHLSLKAAGLPVPPSGASTRNSGSSSGSSVGAAGGGMDLAKVEPAPDKSSNKGENSGRGTDTGPYGRTSGPNLFTTLFTGTSANSTSVPNAGENNLGSNNAPSAPPQPTDDGAPSLAGITERKTLMPRDASEMSYSLLSLTGNVKKLTEMIQTSRNAGESTSNRAKMTLKEEEEAALRTPLTAKDYIIGCQGKCYNTLEIFGMQSEQASTTFLETTVLAKEKEVEVGTNGVDKANVDGGGFDDDCVICMCDVKQIMFLPCRHFCVCPACLIKIDKCPVCRSPFDEYISITKGDRTGSELVVPSLRIKKNL